ncbi:MAG TPA: hypothetical protein VKT77_18660 [Chthonomonadaceae bacterium]|nr:hypothetical protein [Chthonomonadaceae bacterium]
MSTPRKLGSARFDPATEVGIFRNDDGSETPELADPGGNTLKIGPLDSEAK